MLNRRSFLGGLSASMPLLAMPGSGRAQGTRPVVHAMVVGINKYTGRDATGRIKDLKGCLNDAADIEQQVKRLHPASFIRLGWDGTRERTVKREDFRSAWRQTLAAAGSGDTLLLTFSGHGSKVPVVPGTPTDEIDGMDETLVLTDYDVSQGRNGEHIIDDELNEMFQAAHAKGVIVVFIADCCFSGTLTRSVDAQLGDTTYRFVQPPPATRATLVAAPPPVLPNVLFIAGSQEDETVPEIRDPATGQHRGALSVALARALEGGAATDGVITAYGLAGFILRHVALVADGVQHPNIKWPTQAIERGIDRNTRLFVLGEPPPPPPGVRPVRLRIVGRSAAEQERIVSGLRNAALAGGGEADALVWDADRKLLLNDQGQRVAEDIDETWLQHAINRRLALDRLIPMAANGLDVQILKDGLDTPASDATHKSGDALTIKVSGLASGDYLAAFNFTGKGVVQVLEPAPYHPGSPHRADFKRPHFSTGKQYPIPVVPLGDVDVRAPFGADHVVAVAGAQPLRRLMAALVLAHDQPAIPEVMAALVSEREFQPLKIGLRGIYTER